MDNRNIKPSLEDMNHYIHNPLFKKLCHDIENLTSVRYQIDFSACSWEPGWNLKIKKGSRTLCTIYPREGYFCTMVVVGEKEKEAVENYLTQASPMTREIYHGTKEGNGQRWLMIDLEDQNQVYQDVLKLIEMRCRQ